jgi:3-methyl-2-oxobutanoate hydroxymethyltransferase
MGVLTPDDIRAKKGKEKIVCLTAYSAPMAKMLDTHVDVMLVGDSVGMVLYGMENTLGVTMDMMVAHGKAVARAAKQACVVVDMPYGSYENGVREALINARRIIDETGAAAVKLEGGAVMQEVIKALVSDGIPVMGHIGLQPQSVIKEGGYKIKGKSDAEAQALMADALAVQEAGAFCVVIEGTIGDVAVEISQKLSIPTIGIGASVDCDGQVLVIDDMLGMSKMHKPKFVKLYAQLDEQIEAAAARYADEVRRGVFPNESYIYKKGS